MGRLILPNDAALAGAALRRGYGVCHLGDSRCAHGGGSATGSTLIKRHRLPFHVANALLGQRYIDAGNFGVAGDRTDQALARLPLILALRPAFCIWWCAVNDFIQGKTASEVFANTKIFIDKCLVAGIRPIVFTEAGSSQAGYGDSATVIGRTHDYNELIREYAAANPGVIVFDEAKVVLNPVSASLAMKTGYTPDNLHRSNLGAYMDGKELAAVMGPLMPPRPLLPSSVTERYSNTVKQILENGLVTTTTGGLLTGTASGTAPVNWEFYGGTGTGNVVSTAANAEGFGNDILMAMTASSTISGGSYGAPWGRNNLDQTRIVPGDIVQGVAEIEVASPVGIQGVRLVVDVNTDSDVTTTAQDGADSSGGGGPTEAHIYTLATPPMLVTGSVVNWAKLRVEAAFSSASGSVTPHVRRSAVRKIAA